MVKRRDLIRAGAAAALLGGLGAGKARAEVQSHLWEGYDFGPGPRVPDRLNQGPFGVEQTEVWATVGSTSPSEERIRNFGLGMVGYTWEEGGPALPARKGRDTLESQVDKLARLPFVDLLYIRCDWRDVQKQPGRLDLSPVWQLTLDAARRYGLRVAFRVQLSNTVGQPKRIALPDFVQAKVPLVKIGKRPGTDFDFVEPRYDHPDFVRAFRELNELLAARFDSDPLVEFMDLMMYGWWGEGHTSGLPTPFPDFPTAERTFVDLTRIQLETWKKVPLAVNTQPDNRQAGNSEVQDMTVRAGGWLRSDSVIHDEPIQIENLCHRPPWLAVVLEEGWQRQHEIENIPVDSAGVSVKDKSMYMALDMGTNYWALWTEGENLALYQERFPRAFAEMDRRMGYRVRPAWIWQRERYERPELILGLANDGVAGVPGVLRVTVEDPETSFRMSGCLDAGQPYAGKVRQAGFLLPPEMYGRRVRLSAAIETNGVTRPVRWACAQKVESDGALSVQLKDKGKLVWGEVL
jgi:hypothetical protein